MDSIDGTELLVVNGDEADRKGLSKLFADVGFMVSALGDTEAARRTLADKYFPVVVVDSNLTAPVALELVRWLRDTSTTTEVVVTVATPSFEDAARYFRAGALDVIEKRRDVVPYLKERVREAAIGQGLANESVQLLQDSMALCEDFLMVLMDLARKSLPPGSQNDSLEYRVCVVDPEDILADGLAAASNEYQVTHCLTNGEALDKVATNRFNLLVAPVDSDLPGRMVARTALATNAEMDIWLYSGRPGAGQVVPLETGGTEGKTQIFPTPEIFARGVIKRKRHSLGMARERRAMELVKAENAGIIRRYGELRAKVKRAIQAAAND